MTKADLTKAEQIQNALIYFELSTSTLSREISDLTLLATDEMAKDLKSNSPS